jgi:glycosyltransferase involved in cell wall biosynthesis
MSICLVSLDFRPHRTSGHAIFGELLADGLCAAGQTVTVVASRREGAPEQETSNGVRVRRVGIGPTDWIGFSLRAARLVQQLQAQAPFDVVHFLDLHFAYAYRGPFVATLVQPFGQRLQAKGRLPYSRSLPNLVFRYVYYTLAGWTLERWAARRAGMILATSQAVRDAYLGDHPAEADRVVVVPLGVDVEHFRRRDAGALRAELGLEGKRVLLYAGFSTPRKGLEYLGRALDDLGPECRLLMVGKWERGYRQRFERSLSPHSLERIIQVGYVPDEMMPFYYSLADVFVLPSLLEGFGLPLAEAMACGTPIVATTAGSIPEVVGDAGLLVPPMDSQALAGAVHGLLADGVLRRDMGARGVRRARSFYSRDGMVAHTLDAYAAYLGARPTPGALT